VEGDRAQRGARQELFISTGLGKEELEAAFKRAGAVVV